MVPSDESQLRQGLRVYCQFLCLLITRRSRGRLTLRAAFSFLHLELGSRRMYLAFWVLILPWGQGLSTYFASFI